MRRKSIIGLMAAVLVLLVASWAAAEYVYKVNKEHTGGNVTPVEAYEMIQKDPAHTFLVDCRTRAEYQFVGHPVGAVNIPVRFLTAQAGDKGYKEADNPDFGKVLSARFNPQTDTLIFMCRSGSRSCTSCDKALEVGFAKERVFNMMGGFEGDLNKNKASAFYGQRWGGGWKLEGLPWTYDMDPKLMYPPDVAP
jgi:rhodanese-related sulfurtransferase